MIFSEKLKLCGVDANELKNSRIMITGATGLIGNTIALRLSELSDRWGLGIRLFLVLRNEKKLSKELAVRIGKDVSVLNCDVAEFDFSEPVDYIIHGASITSSKLMVENPVEVIRTNVQGTSKILEYALRQRVKSVVFLSSMEAYGFTTDDVVLTEDNMQYLNPLSVRSCYPESKRMAENMCVAYSSQFGLHVKIVRLAQTFGRGVNINDGRVFAEFARNAAAHKDIVLLTDGSSKRMYLDVEDAVTGIVVVLLNGENGRAYNIANKDTYCSILEMAKLVASEIGQDKIKVRFSKDVDTAKCFSPAHKFYLDVSAIEGLGWRPFSDLAAMYNDMVDWWFNP